MDDKAHIALVDAEAKGYSGNHYVYLALHPEILHPVSVTASHTSVVEAAIDVVISEEGSGQFLALVLSDAVNYPALAFKASFEKVNQVLERVSS